jgi:hypothetical protein
MALRGYTSTIYKGEIWIGIPMFRFPAVTAELFEPRNVKKHSIPGRDGDIVDDVGSPARIMTLDCEINRPLLEKVLQESITFGIDPGIFAEPIWFMRLLHEWWLSKLEVPVICAPIQSFVKITNKRTKWEGGHGGRFEIHLELTERLPFSLSSIAGRLILGGAFGILAGLGGFE